MLLVTIDEMVVDKTTEKDERAETQLEMVTLVMEVKITEERSLNTHVSRTDPIKTAKKNEETRFWGLDIHRMYLQTNKIRLYL